MLILLCGLIFLALSFDFINGFHDSANSIATIIATKVLTLWQALLWAALFNFLAFFILPVHVAATMGSGIIKPDYITNTSVAAALCAAILFNLTTWRLKLPSSSSHALIGALAGVGLVQGGVASLHTLMLFIILAFVVISPLVGMGVAYTLIKIISCIQHIKAHKKFFSRLQLVSSALVSLGHGGNDAQKTMGVIAVLLYSNGYLDGAFYVPLWVVFSCYLVIALGTLAGGWRIIETVGYKVTRLKPESGACAEFGAGFILLLANQFGIPISTTHALTGAVVGVSYYNHETIKKTNWHVIGKILLAWVFTFPVSALLAAMILKILQSFAW